MEGQVQKLVGEKEQVIVVLNADARVSHGQIVGVIERVRRVKGVKVAIATTEP